MKLVHWPLTGGLLQLVQRGGDWAGLQPAQIHPRCTKCNSPHPSTASVPITVLLNNGPLLCGFKGLTITSAKADFMRSVLLLPAIQSVEEYGKLYTGFCFFLHPVTDYLSDGGTDRVKFCTPDSFSPLLG